MAVSTYEPTLTTGEVNKIWRKVQGKLQDGVEFLAEEYEMLDDLTEYEGDVSAREITVPVDIEEGAGVASIPEGGWEAIPSSPSLQEITLNWILLNKRFSATKTARYLDRRNAGAQITKQIKWQGKKALQSIGSDFSDRFYGTSTSVVGTVAAGAAAAATHTFTMTNGYGSSLITSAPFIARKIKVGDRIALVNGSTLVTNAIGSVTAKNSTTGAITAVWNGTVTTTTGDQVVKANSMENTTLAGTDWNKGLIGLIDMFTATSLHGLNGSTVENWNPAYTNVTAGRFTGMKLHRIKQEIGRYRTGRPGITILMSEGVERDLIDQYSANVQFNDPLNMEIDGSIKSRGVTFMTTQRVPPGFVFGWTNGSIQKLSLINKPGNVTWEDAKEMQDRSGYLFSMDLPIQLVLTNRRGLAYEANKTEL